MVGHSILNDVPFHAPGGGTNRVIESEVCEQKNTQDCDQILHVNHFIEHLSEWKYKFATLKFWKSTFLLKWF